MVWETKVAQWCAEIRARAEMPLRLTLWDGRSYDLGTFSVPAVTLRVKSVAAVPLLLDPTLDRLGEAYVHGKIDVEGKLSDVIDSAHALARAAVGAPNRLQRVARYFQHSKVSDKQSIQYHYDVSNDFYQLWLDPAMVYSCAYFAQGDEDLATAQQRKIDHILTKIDLRAGQTLLDIGCGWGALVLRAAERFGARCVGVTLSQNQFDLATQRVRAAGLADRVEIRLQDYRELTGQFDRITSVGMFEHVGRKQLPDYFGRVAALLTPDGVVMNHGITSTDPQGGEVAHGGGEFIDRYVFPNGELPHIGMALQAMQQGGLEAFDVENLRRHYARTLRLWSDNYEAHGAQLRALVGEEKFRIWRIYLAGCAHAFDNDDLAIYQIVGRRAGQRAQALPWSRSYMYGAAAAPAVKV